jgi:hypothetical protein
MIEHDHQVISLAPAPFSSFEGWMRSADAPVRSALSHMLALAETGEADVNTWPIRLSHRGAAALSPETAHALGLPPAAAVTLHLEQSGTFPKITVGLRWQRPTGAPYLGVARTGALLRLAGRYAWLPDPLFSIAEAADHLAAVANDEDERMRAVQQLKDVLPDTSNALVDCPGALLSMRFTYVDAFTLDLEDGDDPRLLPQLHRLPNDEDDPAERPLPEAHQQAFGNRFAQFASARSVYPLGNGSYVALSKPLQAAMVIVKAVQAQPAAQRREFFKAPRSLLAAQLGYAYDSTVIEDLFRETQGYSDRVLGLGLWQKRVLPWVKVGASEWFGPSDGQPTTRGIQVGERMVELSAAHIPLALVQVTAAMAAEQNTVEIETAEGPVRLPVTAQTIAALESLNATCHTGAPATKKEAVAAAEALLIMDGVDADTMFARGLNPRHHRIEANAPMRLQTALKPHQQDGIAWLCSAWNAGRPGVLLADDMGLGKTLQALAFMAMVRDAMLSGLMPEKPLLIVAPTGLLANWEAEHDKHLVEPGLGRLIRAFGPHLQRLKSGKSALSPSALRGGDWVLTTYETLRDHQTAFAAVPFAMIAFDEAQRIKNPAVQITHVAKGMNADFAIALTGTPIENRLADLWSIIDTVHPGLLGDLAAFSKRFEVAPDAIILQDLRQSLELGSPSLPAPMLRRMKSDHLRDLPAKHEIVCRRSMPSVQVDVYLEAINAARVQATPHGKLSALHQIRQISLHPRHDAVMEDDEYIGCSARLLACFEVLDKAAVANEKALIFVDSLQMQANLAALIQRRYRLRTTPMLINGSVAGTDRQRRVDAFQGDALAFDAMILSPRAGGVGLTLTAATHVIHLSRWWNPAVEDQCTDRAYRIGQKSPVSVHLLMAVLPGRVEDSFDTKLDELLTRKRHLSRNLLQPPAGTEADRDALFADVIGR